MPTLQLFLEAYKKNFIKHVRDCCVERGRHFPSNNLRDASPALKVLCQSYIDGLAVTPAQMENVTTKVTNIR